MADKIKSLSVKGGSNYPIGSDAKLIDTFSNLDLESLIKLGGSCYTTVRYSNTGEITEEFFSQNINIQYTDQDQTTIDSVIPNQPYYRLETVFNALEDINISDENNNFIVTEQDDSSTEEIDETVYLVDRAEVETTYEHIIKRLYYKKNNISEENFIARKDIYKIPKDNNIYDTVEKISFNEE